MGPQRIDGAASGAPRRGASGRWATEAELPRDHPVHSRRARRPGHPVPGQPRRHRRPHPRPHRRAPRRRDRLGHLLRQLHARRRRPGPPRRRARPDRPGPVAALPVLDRQPRLRHPGRPDRAQARELPQHHPGPPARGLGARRRLRGAPWAAPSSSGWPPRAIWPWPTRPSTRRSCSRPATEHGGGPPAHRHDAHRRRPRSRAAGRLAAAKDRGGADLLFVGKVSPHKAPHDLVKMLAVYRRLYDPPARLHLVGSPLGERYGPALAAFVDDLGLGDAVSVTGSVTAAELEAYYRAADVFVCASDHEGFCVPLVEAMGHGVPVVAYGVTAVPETVGHAGLVLADKEPLRFAAAVAPGRPDAERAAGSPAAAAERVRRVLARAGRAAGSSTSSPGRRRLSRLSARRLPAGSRTAASRSTSRSPASARPSAGSRGPAATSSPARPRRLQPGTAPATVGGSWRRAAPRPRPAPRAARPRGRPPPADRGPWPRPPAGRSLRARRSPPARRPRRRPRPGVVVDPAGEVHGVDQPEVGDVATQRVGVAARAGSPITGSVGRRVVTRAVGEEGGDGVLHRLVGRQPTDRQPAAPDAGAVDPPPPRRRLAAP